jgi:hypothetical protein
LSVGGDDDYDGNEVKTTAAEERVELYPVAYPGIFSSGRGNFFFRGGSSINSVEDRGQRERGSGGGSPPVRGSTQFANE